MALTSNRTYVGFGFGAIQAGLFLYEAFRSDAFGQLVVAEVLPGIVQSIRDAAGRYTLNIALADRIDNSNIGPVEIENPADEADRLRLIDAVADAHEIGTAVPSVEFYISEGRGSIHRILAEGFREKVRIDGSCAVVYCAENHNRAAEILESAVMVEVPEDEREAVRSRVRFLNTVIGKMSGIVTDADEIKEGGLLTMAPDCERAFLVEEFNRILISKIEFNGEFTRGFSVFSERDDLIPFCEAKLYGHNATHALAGYLACVLGMKHISELRDVPGVMEFLRAAFIEESGEALIRKHTGADRLFSPEGYCEYADDLLDRMTNPWLRDSVDRVIRGTERKLGWNDRLVGTMRVALEHGVRPERYAFGIAAALTTLDDNSIAFIESLWRKAQPVSAEKEEVLQMLREALIKLSNWRDSGFANLEVFFRRS